MSSYHDLICWFRTALDRDPWGDGYLAGFGGWFRERAGIERVPDFKLASTASGFPVAPGQRYHVVAGCIGAHSFLCIDGVVAVELFDPNPLPPAHEGHFGFGLYESHVRYERLEVYRPAWVKVEEKYA